MIIIEGNEAIQLPSDIMHYSGKELIITNESKKPIYIYGTGHSIEPKQRLYFSPGKHDWNLIGFDG